MKKIMILCLIGLLSFSLASCGSKSGDKEQTAALNETESAAPTEETEKEIDLDYAIDQFNKQDARDFINERLDDYPVISGSEITALVQEKTWNVVEILPYGNWTGKFHFNENGSIKETIYDGSQGYFNNRSWYVTGDTIVISTDNEENKSFTIRSIDANTYIGILNGSAELLLSR